MQNSIYTWLYSAPHVSLYCFSAYFVRGLKLLFTLANRLELCLYILS